MCPSSLSRSTHAHATTPLQSELLTEQNMSFTRKLSQTEWPKEWEQVSVLRGGYTNRYIPLHDAGINHENQQEEKLQHERENMIGYTHTHTNE